MGRGKYKCFKELIHRNVYSTSGSLSRKYLRLKQKKLDLLCFPTHPKGSKTLRALPRSGPPEGAFKEHANPPCSNTEKWRCLKETFGPNWCGSVGWSSSHKATKQKVASSIPSQGTCLGFRFGPQLGRVQEATDQCFSLTLMLLSLSPSLPFSQIHKFKKIYVFLNLYSITTQHACSYPYTLIDRSNRHKVLNGKQWWGVSAVLTRSRIRLWDHSFLNLIFDPSLPALLKFNFWR